MALRDAFDLSGKVAVVTGGSRGLGLAFASALGEAGARVAICGRDADQLTAGLEQVRQHGPDAVAVPADITRRADVENLLAEVTAALGPPDILINNAGSCIHRPALEVTDQEWDAVLDVNLRALWLCSQVFGRVMVERRRGVIVNIGSISAMIVNRPQWQPAYNASKAAVHQLTKSLAAEWAPYGVRVNALSPGYVKTEMAPVDRPEFRRYWVDDVPMLRYALPEELGPSVVYLASAASAFMTGSVLVIDGGYTLW
jgi:NAD(P)-dependent dehydrogenase (short-subunit alcohol dehydrogenase family)